MKKSIILCCFATFGVVGTAVMTAKAALKAEKILKKPENEGLCKKELFLKAAPVYIPAIMLGLGTICCIFGVHTLNKKRQASLIGAYSLINNSYQEYRRKLTELYGKDVDIEIRNAMAREHCNFHQIGFDKPDEKALFYDEISGESVFCYEREIMDAEYHLNRNFALRGYAFLNEFYEFLGLPPTEYGGIAGWAVISGMGWIDFEHRMIDNDDGGAACYSIDMIFYPEVLEEWEY